MERGVYAHIWVHIHVCIRVMALEGKGNVLSFWVGSIVQTSNRSAMAQT
jgi:hypothetical protein